MICITIVAVILYTRYYKWICHEETNTEQGDDTRRKIDDTTINAFESDVSSQSSVATPATSPTPSVSNSSSRNNRSSRTYYDDDEDEYDEDGMYKDEDEDIKDKRQYDDYDDDEADDWE